MKKILTIIGFGMILLGMALMPSTGIGDYSAVYISYCGIFIVGATGVYYIF